MLSFPFVLPSYLSCHTIAMMELEIYNDTDFEIMAEEIVVDHLMIQEEVSKVLKGVIKKVEANVIKANKPRSEATRKRETRCKRRKTLFKKTAEFMKATQLPTILCVQCNDGTLAILGTPSLEKG